MNAIAAIQYALFKNPNSLVFGGTAAARCTAAIRLPDNPKWTNKGWFAEARSAQTLAASVPAKRPGGSIVYNPGVGATLYGGPSDLLTPSEEFGNASLRDNGNRIEPFENELRIREPQLYGTLMECRARAATAQTPCLYFIGFGSSLYGATDIASSQRMCGFVSTGTGNNWRAVVIRNVAPNDGLTPGVTTKDTTLGLAPGSFHNFVLEVSGGGHSARWRASSGAWTNSNIPIVATATKAELHSRPGEGPVAWGATVRETEQAPVTVAGLELTRLSVHAWRPGFVATVPSFRKKP